MPYTDRETRLAYHREYYQRTKATQRQRTKDRYAVDPEYRRRAREQRRRWAQANPERRRYLRWKDRCRARDHGHPTTTWENFLTILRTRPEACQACEVPITGRYGHMDHNHRTGLARGWLCHDCNTLLGKRNEDPDQLPPHLIEYLARTDV